VFLGGEGDSAATRLATGGEGSVVGGRKILWAWEKSEKEFRVKKIKIQRRRSRQYIELPKTLDTIGSNYKRKHPICSKLIYILVTKELKLKGIKTPALKAGFFYMSILKTAGQSDVCRLCVEALGWAGRINIWIGRP